MHIAIVEDMPEDQAELIHLLKRYCSERKLEAQFTVFSSADDLLAQFSPGNFQLIFLDIYMNGINGMDAARVIYKSDPACRLIFLTTSHTHAVTSYEVRASWYFTKPVEYGKLAEVMDDTCNDIIKDHMFLTFHIAGIESKIPFGEILFIDCIANCTRLHLENNVLTIDEREKDISSVLFSDERFINCNRNVTVNMDWIETVSDSEFHMKNGEHVPIRQKGRSPIKKRFLAWSLKNLRTP